MSHLRFGPKPLTSSYLIGEADYLGIHLQAYLNKYDCLSRLKQGGVLVINATWKNLQVSTLQHVFVVASEKFCLSVPSRIGVIWTHTVAIQMRVLSLCRRWRLHCLPRSSASWLL